MNGRLFALVAGCALAGASRAVSAQSPRPAEPSSARLIAAWISGYGVRDDALLAGVRTDNPRVFGTVALGFAAARPYENCACGSGGELTSKVNGLAYDVGLHANVLILGGALSFSGLAFAPRANYLMVNLGLEAGWFGP